MCAGTPHEPAFLNGSTGMNPDFNSRHSDQNLWTDLLGGAVDELAAHAPGSLA